jgi:hypothetical protein
MITTPTNQNPGMPSSDEFWILGSGYLDAGNACLSLIRNGKADGKPYCGNVVFPCMFSFFRSIELGLKAILKENGSTDNEIARVYGHRLNALLDALDSKDIDLQFVGITPEDRVFLNKYSEEYSRKWYEYPDDLWRVSFEPEVLQKLAERICERIRNYKVELNQAESRLS